MLLLFHRYFSLTASGKAKGGESMRVVVGGSRKEKKEKGVRRVFLSLFLPSRPLSQKGVAGARVLKLGWG